jgi:multidrug resistance efflux pump
MIKSELTSFSRTMRALDADGMSPMLLAVILVAGLIGVWSTWLVIARVPVYELSQAARLEIEHVHPVASTASGRVVATSLVLGREVKQGDVLLEVEAGREQLETADEQRRLSTLAGEVDALNRQIANHEQALEETLRASRAGLAEASERVTGTAAAAKYAADKLNRLMRLNENGLVSAVDIETARAEKAGKDADLAAARVGIDRFRAEQIAMERSKRGELNSLTRQRLNLEGERAGARSTVALRERETELRRIRAPMSGRLGEVNPIQIGAVIREGDSLASILPDGEVRVVAEFTAPALGRLRPGQRGRLRLEGFPWTQYGHVNAVVTKVATETRQQRVRVELAVNHASDSLIPLQHGMPGMAEIEIERVAPLSLLLRSLGHALSGTVAAAAAEPNPAGTR